MYHPAWHEPTLASLVDFSSASRGTGRGNTVGEQLAGHADLTTTLRYMHPSPAATEDAIRVSP